MKMTKKPDSDISLKTCSVHKICITKHKIDIQTHQKNWLYQIPIFRSIFFPRNYTVLPYIYFLLNTSNIFRSTAGMGAIAP